MPDTLINILIQLGGIWFTLGVLVVIALSAWLGQIWATRINHRENEKTRASLQKALDENKISYEHWYNEQAKVIQNIYSHISMVHLAARRYFNKAISVSNNHQDISKLSSSFTIFEKAFDDGKAYYQKNKILIPENELQNLDEFWDITQKICFLGLSLQKNEMDSNSLEKSKSEGNAYLKKCSEQLTSLRHDFREILKGKIQ